MEMDVRIQDITLANFAGIGAFEMHMDGRSALISGGNATGKTTVGNAIIWLLTGKNMAGGQMNPLPKGCDQGVTASVEATLLVDGNPVTLRREICEEVAKRRAENTERKYTTKCYYDGAPVTVSAYDDCIRKITPQETIPLLMLPGAVARMHWTDMRRLMVSLYGETDEAELMRAMSLDDLAEAKGRLSWDQFRAKLATEKRNTMKDQAALPGRIDEMARKIDSAKGARTVAELDRLIEDAQARRQALTEQLRPGDGSAEEARLRAALAQLNADEKAYASAITARSAMEFQLQGAREELARLEKDRDEARAAYKKAKVLQADGSRCPYCAQPLPPDKAADLTAEYEHNRDELCKGAREKGLALKARIEKTEETIRTLEQKLSAEGAPVPRDWALERDALSARIRAARETAAGNGAPEREQIQALEQAIAGMYRERGVAEGARESALRRDELVGEQQRVNAKLDRIVQLQSQSSEFLQAYAEQSADRINEHFRRVRFEMIELTNDNTPKETCAIMVGGVEYQDSKANELNTEACVNAGLEIIGELGRCTGVRWPVLIDNAEAVEAHRLLPVKAQTITFRVEEYQSKLTVRYTDEEDEKAC